MGHSRVVPYVLHITTILSRVGSVFHTPMEWKINVHGKPTIENLDQWVTQFEESTQPDGCNAHLGYDPVVRAKIVKQKTGEVQAVWIRPEQRKNEPLFQVI